MNPKVKPSNLPPDVEDRHILLIDDVLHTGRTIRAAMNELFDYGRPASITLLCLIERSGRELPLQADIVGQHIELNDDEHIKLSGPEPLTFEVQKT
jgi:pyrimidine operon attenuation protein/uracil phosphoribosyltransferase